MKILFGIIAISILAFTGSRWSFAHFRMPQFAVQVFFTGAEFILVGVLLGPFVLNIIDPETWNALHPIRALCLGWIGFVFGLHLEPAVVRRFPREFLRIALFMPMAVAVMVCIPFALALGDLFGLSSITAWTVVFVLSFAAAHTGPSSVAIFQKTHALKRSQMLNLFRFVAGLDAYPGVIATGFAGAVLSTEPPFGSMVHPASAWFLITTLTGLLMGAVIVLLMQTRPSDQEVFVYLTGVIVLLGGIGFYFHQSCLYMAALAGAVAANHRTGARLHILASVPERTIYIILLILAASSIDPATSIQPMLIVIYIVLRFTAKLVAGSGAASIWGRWPITHRTLGLGLISEGGMSVAMAMTMQQIMPGPITDTMLAVVLVTVFFHELVSPYALEYVFKRAGML